MIITLGDVSALFHLPICGLFFTAPIISGMDVVMTIIQDMGVIEEEVIKEFG